jgi:hypothetical protein
MHRTRVILAQSGGGIGRATSQRFLIPSENLWDLVGASFSGIWAHLSDPLARDQYQKFLADDVIKDTVLAQSNRGSMLPMALFDNLRSPLFAKYNFDAVEFIDGVVPALEKFNDTLGLLVHDMSKATNDKPEGDIKNSEVLSVFADGNKWREQAKENPESLAAQLAKMVTAANLDDHFYGAKLFQSLTDGAGSTVQYVPGSCVVGPVALLSARVLEIDTEDRYGEEHPELAASDESSKDPPVAARLDVLYEITQTYQQAPDPLSPAEQYKAIDSTTTKADSENPGAEDPGANPEAPADGDTTITKKSAPAAEEATFSETILAVAVFEGWLNGGPDNGLRWKVAMVRDAVEF